MDKILKQSPAVQEGKPEALNALALPKTKAAAVPSVRTGARQRVLALLAAFSIAAAAASCEPFTAAEDGSGGAGGDAGGGGEGGNNIGGEGGTDAGGSSGVPASPELSTFTLISPIPTPKVLGVEGDGVQTGLLTATIKDINGSLAPGRTIIVDKMSGPGSPVIKAVACSPGDKAGETNSDGKACFEVSSTTFGSDEFTATEMTSEPDVEITQKANVTFCYGVTFDTADATMPRWDAKFFTPACADLDAVNLNTAGSPFETVSGKYCLVPPFKFTANVNNAPAKNSLTLIVTDPVRITNPVRVKDVGSISVSNSYHNNICADPTVGGTSQSVNPVSGDQNLPTTDKTLRLEAPAPADVSGGAVWYGLVQ